MRFSAVVVWVVLWVTVVYFPLAHMVWYWPGPDFLKDAPADTGLIWGWGALDFAGGTVVHINAGVAGLVGCIIVGQRFGFPREPMPPHSLTLDRNSTRLNSSHYCASRMQASACK